MKYFLFYVFIMSFISFFVMYIDKRKAIKDKWRIKESTLFTLAIIGGSLGVLLGMKVWHHKTKHMSFVIGIPVILILQLVLLGFVYYRSKAQLL